MIDLNGSIEELAECLKNIENALLYLKASSCFYEDSYDAVSPMEVSLQMDTIIQVLNGEKSDEWVKEYCERCGE